MQTTTYLVAGPPCDDLIHQAEAGPRPPAPLISYERGVPTARRGHGLIDSALWDLVARGAALLRAVYPDPVPVAGEAGEPPPGKAPLFAAPLTRAVYPEPGSWAARLRQGTQIWIQGREALRLYLSDDGLRVAADNGDAVAIAEILADLPPDMTEGTGDAPAWAHEENARKRTISRAWPGDLRALLAAAEPHRLPARVLSAIDRGGWRRFDAIVGFAIAVRRMRCRRDGSLARQVLAVAESLGIGVRMYDDELAGAHGAGYACAWSIDQAARGTADLEAILMVEFSALSKIVGGHGGARHS